MSVVSKKFRSLSEITVKSVFYESQFTKKHDSNIKELKNLYKETKLEDFLGDFIHCLKVCFLQTEASQLVENSLDFAAKFSVSLSNNLGLGVVCPFLDGILQFLFESHGCENCTVRYRVCHFLNRLFNNMGCDAVLDEDVIDKIGSCMMDRLQDKMAKVRAEAVYALHRLQDPSDPSCRITSVFLFHLRCDPSHEVRCAILETIAVNKKTIPFVLRRIHDIKDVVRRDAYAILSKVTVQRLSIRQRQSILENGLNDKFVMVRSYIVEKTLPAWLDAYNSNYIEFMQSINVESFTDITMLALKALFKKQHAVPLASMGIENKVIPYSILCSERVFFWRALAEYLKPTDDNLEEESVKHFDNVLPELTPFTQYIQQYFFPSKKTERENAPKEFVLVQLLHMTKIYDFSDEKGRLCLKDLCMDLLISSRVGPTATRVIAQLLSYIHLDQNERLSFMAEIVSELKEPLSTPNATFIDESEALQAQIAAMEFDLIQLSNISHDEAYSVEHIEKINKIKFHIKMLERERDKLEKSTVIPDEDGRTSKNDSKTLIKCLTFITTVIEAEDITEMNPVLYSLLQNFILPILDTKAINDETVHNLALQALGIFCTLDLQIAKEKFFMFCFQISIANETVSITSLKVVFDLLHFHGLDVFDIEEPAGDFTNNEMICGVMGQKTNLIYLLITLLNSQMSLMRNITFQGLCKLIYAKRICNPYLLKWFFVLWFNPDLENDAQLRQSLTVFFNMFATNFPNASNMILDCFISTLNAFSRGGFREVVGKVDINDVANLMINLTRPSVNKYDTKKNIHNLLAIKMCKEILEFNEDLDIGVMIKVLLQLDLNYEIEADIETIEVDIKQIKKIIERGRDKVNLKLISKLQLMVEGRQLEANHSVSTVRNTLLENESMISTNESHDRSNKELRLISNKEFGTSLENTAILEETCHFEFSLLPLPLKNEEGIIVPGTPDSEYESVNNSDEGIIIAGTPDSLDEEQE